jgi:Cys-rich repeat protein
MGNCGPLGVCDPSGQFCVQCAQNTDCGAGEVCDTTVYECVECTADADCALKPGRNLCDPANGTCVGCVSNADCASGEECIPQGVCATPTGRGLCVPCNDDAQCGNGTTDLCIGYVGTAGLFDRACAIDCANDPSVCPNGFECVSVRMGAMQCRPRYDMQTPTCTATRHLGDACFPDPNDLDPGCGIDAVQDARCEPNAAGSGVCVVWCQDNTDCANGTTCQGSSTGMRMICL